MYQRQQAQTLRQRIEETRKFIQVIAGPRQVGKSTLVKQVLHEINVPYHFAVAEDAPDRNPVWIREQWQQARQKMDFNHYSQMLLIIDEIHKFDNWSEVVKGEWDKDSFNDRNLKVIILGSSRLLLMDGLTESLAGRFELINMEHWSYKEMHDAFGFDLYHYIYFGGYPGGASLVGDEKRWRNYIQNAIIEPAIAKDVLLTKRVYKPALLKQLFLLGCSYSGELLAFNKILGQLQDAGNTDTLATYLNVLDESCLLAGLQKYAVDNARKYRSIPKFLVYNSALLSATDKCSFEQVVTDDQKWGRWVETAVGTHLINNAKKLNYEVYYWRQKNEEVDYILLSNNKLVVIEVKSGRRKLNSGIFTFEDSYHPLRTWVVGTGGLDIEQFLQSDLSFLFME